MRDQRFRFSIPAVRRHVPVWLALAVLATLPTTTRAETFFDFYAGAGFPQKSNVRADADDPFVDADIDYRSKVKWEDPTPSLGLRGGHWFEFDEYGPSIVGFALDVSYYRAFEDSNFAELDVWATPLTPLLMLRIPIGYSEEYPGGRIQPYGAVGPSFTLAFAHADIDEITPSNPSDFAYDEFDAAGFGVGLDARGGIAFQLAPSFAIFTEYRYSLVKPEFEDEVDVASTPFGFSTDVEFQPKLETHHVVLGVSFRF